MRSTLSLLFHGDWKQLLQSFLRGHVLQFFAHLHSLPWDPLSVSFLNYQDRREHGTSGVAWQVLRAFTDITGKHHMGKWQTQKKLESFCLMQGQTPLTASSLHLSETTSPTSSLCQFSTNQLPMHLGNSTYRNAGRTLACLGVSLVFRAEWWHQLPSQQLAWSTSCSAALLRARR